MLLIGYIEGLFCKTVTCKSCSGCSFHLVIKMNTIVMYCLIMFKNEHTFFWCKDKNWHLKKGGNIGVSAVMIVCQIVQLLVVIIIISTTLRCFIYFCRASFLLALLLGQLVLTLRLPCVL